MQTYQLKIYALLLVHFLGNFLLVTPLDILLCVLYYGVKSWYISQENQFGYDSGNGIMNYTL